MGRSPACSLSMAYLPIQQSTPHLRLIPTMKEGCCRGTERQQLRPQLCGTNAISSWPICRLTASEKLVLLLSNSHWQMICEMYILNFSAVVLSRAIGSVSLGAWWARAQRRRHRVTAATGTA
eukprot:1814018-Rhodomonas_salina.1